MDKRHLKTRARFIKAAACAALLVLAAAEAAAHPSWGIAVDREGQVYFSDLKTVWKIDARGGLSVLRAEGDRHTHDLNTDEAGNLYGADNSYDPATQRFFSAVWKMTPAGAFSYLLPLTENPPKGTSIWRDREGSTYHVTHHPGRELLVLKRTPAGEVVALVGGREAASGYRQGVPYSAGGMAFGPDGSLYFTHGANVSRLTPDGGLKPLARDVAAAGTSERAAGGSQLFGIAVDARGNAYVADYGNKRVLKIAPDGGSGSVLSSEAPWHPTGVAVRGADVYILELGHTPAHQPLGTRVRRLSAEGAVKVLATIGAEKAAADSAPAVGTPGGGAANAVESEKLTERVRPVPNVLLWAGLCVLPAAFIVWLWLSRRGRGRDSPT